MVTLCDPDTVGLKAMAKELVAESAVTEVDSVTD
jgi:hypothetical protein